MIYTIYNLKTGRITKTISCSAEQIRIQFDANREGVIEGEYSDATHYIASGGVPIKIPSAPNQHCRFDFDAKRWIDPRTPETEWAVVRRQRDALISKTDWVVLPDVQMSDERRAAWTAYRQALRDVTSQPDPFNITWPVAPT